MILCMQRNKILKKNLYNGTISNDVCSFIIIITVIDPVGIDYIHMDRNGIGPGCNSKTAWFIITYRLHVSCNDRW